MAFLVIIKFEFVLTIDEPIKNALVVKRGMQNAERGTALLRILRKQGC